jgi:hypothetical protein
MIFTRQEKNTLAAALTYYLSNDQGEPSSRSDEIHNIACGEHPLLEEDISMDREGIEDLIGKVINYA